jgi:hypothetical protein
MRATVLYRIASILLILFALGHTIGFLNFKPPTPEVLAVRDAMRNVHFEFKGASFSYGGFYTGFGLFVTAYLLFSAYLAWHLSSLAARQPQTIGGLGWAFLAVQLAAFVLSWIYFFAAPAAFSAIVAACVGWAAFDVSKSIRSAPSLPAR